MLLLLRYSLALFFVHTCLFSPVHARKFTDPSSALLQNLEREIVYVYDVANPEKVAAHYMRAINQFERAKPQEQHLVTLPSLQAAYEEVARQVPFTFDVLKAAEYEYKLIEAQARKSTFEEITKIMVDLYSNIFDGPLSEIEEAARLRTFLYQHKIFILSSDKKLTQKDCQFLRNIDHRSKKILKRLHQRATKSSHKR